MMILSQKVIAVGLAAAIALSVSLVPGAVGTASAAPLSVNSPALKEAVPSDVIDVHRRWYRGYGGGAAVAGLALGIMGAAIAARHYDRYYGPYYGAPYYYPYGYYGYRPYRYRPYRYYGRRYYRPYRYYW